MLGFECRVLFMFLICTDIEPVVSTAVIDPTSIEETTEISNVVSVYIHTSYSSDTAKFFPVTLL